MHSLFLTAVLILASMQLHAADESMLDTIEYGPLESFAIGLRYAAEGHWDEHFQFSIHSSDIPKLEQEKGKHPEEFLEEYKASKIPRQIAIYQALSNTAIPIFPYNGETVAWLHLDQPIDGIGGLLMYKEGHRFTFRNSSLVRDPQVAELKAAMAAAEIE